MPLVPHQATQSKACSPELQNPQPSSRPGPPWSAVFAGPRPDCVPGWRARARSLRMLPHHEFKSLVQPNLRRPGPVRKTGVVPVNQPSFLIKAATLVSSLLLVGGCVSYRAGAFNGLTGATATPAVPATNPPADQ